MKEGLQNALGFKVTFYTHPLCKASWDMHQDWLRFYTDYHQLVSIKLCMGETGAENAPDIKSAIKSNLAQAVKAASLQSDHAAHLYLSALREMIWQQEADVSSLELPVIVARGVSKQHRSHLDFSRFISDITGKSSNRALKEDLKKLYINRISTLPTITATKDGKGVKLEGSQSYQQMVKAISLLLPNRLPAIKSNSSMENANRSFL